MSAHTRPGSSSTATPSFPHAVHRCWGEANESWRIQSWPDVRVPPLLVVSPLTERAIWAAESRRQAHPSPRPALWACSQRDRLGELAGTGAPRSLAKMEHVFIILPFSGVKNMRESLYLMRRGWFQPRSLTGHRCIPNCCVKAINNPSYFHINMYVFFPLSITR